MNIILIINYLSSKVLGVHVGIGLTIQAGVIPKGLRAVSLKLVMFQAPCLCFDHWGRN